MISINDLLLQTCIYKFMFSLLFFIIKISSIFVDLNIYIYIYMFSCCFCFVLFFVLLMTKDTIRASGGCGLGRLCHCHRATQVRLLPMLVSGCQRDRAMQRLQQQRSCRASTWLDRMLRGVGSHQTTG